MLLPSAMYISSQCVQAKTSSAIFAVIIASLKEKKWKKFKESKYNVSANEISFSLNNISEI
jgi:hypothetical protein